MRRIFALCLVFMLCLVALTGCDDLLDDFSSVAKDAGDFVDWVYSDDSASSSSSPRMGTATFSEIRAAYRDNEIAADDEYKGNRYELTATFDGATDGGIGNLGGTITVTAKIMDGGTACYIYCKFPDSSRDKIAALSKGDSFTFRGTCVDWGNWKDCSFA